MYAELPQKLLSALIVAGDRAIPYLPASVQAAWCSLRITLKEREQDCFLRLPQHVRSRDARGESKKPAAYDVNSWRFWQSDPSANLLISSLA